MSLFLPSQLSPNFEEVTVDEPLFFQFQVNTNGSQVRSYKLEILNDKNDAEDPEDNILATFYGVFDTPLYNKEIGYIIIDQIQLQEQNLTLLNYKDYRWRVRLYEDEIDIDTNINIKHEYGSTYVGAGNLVGSTKNVIWLSQYDNTIREDLYVQTYCRSYYTDNDFKPFKVDEKEAKIKDIKSYTISDNQSVEHTYTNKFAIDPSLILPKYKEKIDDGNMYFYIRTQSWRSDPTNPTTDSRLIQDWYPKKITGLSYEDGKTWINIEENQAYRDYELNKYEGQEADYYSLWYVQRQQIYSVDKSIGQKQLTKITLDKPFEYNIIHNMQIETNLYSNDFDYDRVYIKPVEEFDNKTSGAGISYINIAYRNEDLIITHNGSTKLTNITKSDLERYPNCKKITNYVGTTGEVTLFSNLDFMPDRFYMYQIFDIVDGTVSVTDDGTYECIAGVQYNGAEVLDDNRYFLGGAVLPKGASPCSGSIQNDPVNSPSTLKIYSNHLESEVESEEGTQKYYSVFIQPNVGITEDIYKPCQLDLYNNKLQQYVSITNSRTLLNYNKYLSIDTLDNSQWLVTLSPIQSNTGNDNLEIDKNLLWSQTKYKIYTNFVNSIPEGYFYVRPDKELSFEYYDTYIGNKYEKDMTGVWYNEYKKAAISAKDILIRCNIHDKGSLGNFVPIKSYQYTISSNKFGYESILYQSDKIYDGKMECLVRGLETCLNSNNEFETNIFYVIQITVEDEYGKFYNYSESIYANYELNIDYDNISVVADSNLQCIHINFSPIKDFIGEVQKNNLNATIATENGALIDNKDGLTFQFLNNNKSDQINIPKDFVMYFRMQISQNLLEKESGIYDIFKVQTDSEDTYKIQFDTRPYYYENGKFSTNSNYLSFYCWKNSDKIKTFTFSNIFSNSNIPTTSTGFKYFINELTEIDNTAIYLISDTDTIINTDEQSLYTETAYKDNESNYYTIGDSDDNTDYIWSETQGYINKQNSIHMKMLFFKIDTVAKDIFQISTSEIKSEIK